MSQIEMLPWFIWKRPNKFPQVCSCSLVYAICTLAEFCWCVRLWNKAAHIKKIIENSIGPAVLWDLLNVKNSPQIHKLLVTIHSVLLILVNIVLVRKGLASHFTISGCFPADINKIRIINSFIWDSFFVSFFLGGGYFSVCWFVSLCAV